MQQSQWHAPGAVDNAPAPARESSPVIETKVAIVLADIRGFASLMASHPPKLMAQLNNDHRGRGEPALYAGVAVNTGAVMAGSFGPAHHQAFTVIGESVNLAARMEGVSPRA